MNQLGLYIFNGFAPSPQVGIKLRPTKENSVNGNDIINQDFGTNGELRHQ